MMLALDGASRVTGFSIFSDNGDLIEYDTFDFSNIKNVDIRIHKMKEGAC